MLLGALGLGTPDHQVEDDHETGQHQELQVLASRRGTRRSGGIGGMGGRDQKAHELLL
ncbi:hypothetical protein D3C78_1806140 [compost metagenome]